MRQAMLSGEHPSLPAAELRGLLAVYAPGSRLHVDGPLAAIDGPDAAVDKALRRMALLHAWGEPWGAAEDSPHGLGALYDVVRARANGFGTAAVVTQRRGRDKSPRVLQVERSLGAALGESGHAIDLGAPQTVVYAWLVDGRIHIGRLLGGSGRSAYEARVPDRRAHFSPVALHPRRAATLLHLARVAPGGRVLDPFCGTGTLVLEAALEGYDVLASDLDPFMVQGTLQTLADTADAPLPGTVFVADVGDTPALLGTSSVDAIVTDMPYGRASSMQGESAGSLYGRALFAFGQLLVPGGHAVVGCDDLGLLASAAEHGLEAVETHSEKSHRSLTRHFTVLRRRGAATASRPPPEDGGTGDGNAAVKRSAPVEPAN